MPRFLLPILVLSFFSLTAFGYVVLKLSPGETLSVILFLTTFFLTLTFLLSVIFFFLHQKFFFKPAAFTAFGPLVTDDERRAIFRASLRRAVLFAVIVIVLLVLGKLV